MQIQKPTWRQQHETKAVSMSSSQRQRTRSLKERRDKRGVRAEARDWVTVDNCPEERYHNLRQGFSGTKEECGSCKEECKGMLSTHGPLLGRNSCSEGPLQELREVRRLTDWGAVALCRFCDTGAQL